MAYYRSKFFGVEASVDAINKDSADSQLKWLMKSNPCFCYDCRERYYKDYSVRVLTGYDNTNVSCTSTSQLSSMRLV